MYVSNVSSNNYIFYDTANYPLDVVKNLPAEIETGIYFGWASVDGGIVHKMVMSIGWNPYFENKEKSMVCDPVQHFVFAIDEYRIAFFRKHTSCMSTTGTSMAVC